jgi:hypothetical protein
MFDDCILLSNVISTKLSLKNPFELLHGTIPILHTRLKMFSEVGVITTKDKIQAKLTNQGTTCIFVGYAENHSKDVYQMLNLKKNAIINSRDIIWLTKMHKDWIKTKLMPFSEEEKFLELYLLEGKKINEIFTNVTEDERNKSDKKVFRAIKKLESWFNLQSTKAIDDYNCGREILLEQINLDLFTTAMIKEPANY